MSEYCQLSPSVECALGEAERFEVSGSNVRTGQMRRAHGVFWTSHWDGLAVTLAAKCQLEQSDGFPVQLSPPIKYRPRAFVNPCEAYWRLC